MDVRAGCIPFHRKQYGRAGCILGLATEFRSEKLDSRNGFRYSAEESGHSEFYGRVNSEARNGTE